jgi:hypothetical protein
MAEELTAETITDAQIEALKQSAGKLGDFFGLRVCRRALDGEREARQLCAAGINAARREEANS